MDNLTHTLIGLGIAEAAIQLRARRPRNHAAGEASGLNMPLRVLAVVASNFPDGDSLYAPLTGGKIGYLLHHRGHTHTLLAGIPITLALAAAFLAYSRIRKRAYGRSDWLWLFAIMAVSHLLHLFADSWNSYGIHPFWPFDNRWIYGDSVFIMEPLIWFSLIPALFWSTQRFWGRIAYAAVLVAGAALGARSQLIPLEILGGILFYTVALFAAFRPLRPLTRIMAALAWVGCWIAIFFATSHLVRSRATELLRTSFPENTIHDISLTPMPANPLCWVLISVEVDSRSQTYISHLGTVAPWPRLLRADQCPSRLFNPGESHSANLEKVALPDSASFKWEGQYRAPLRELSELMRAYCIVPAFLRFLRNPFWSRDENGDVVMGDLRFDRDRSRSFSKIDLDQHGKACPRHVPKWTEPRLDLIKESAYLTDKR